MISNNYHHLVIPAIKKKHVIHKCVLLVCFIFISGNISAVTLSQNEIKDDIEILSNTRHSLELATDFMLEPTDLFLSGENQDTRLTSQEQRKEIWLFWQGFLDRILMLDAIGSKYEALYSTSSGEPKKQLFRVSYAAFLMQYRYAVEIINHLENNPSMHTMLNEPASELGLVKNTYKKLKFRFLNIARAAEFIRLNTVYSMYKPDDIISLTPSMMSDISC